MTPLLQRSHTYRRQSVGESSSSSIVPGLVAGRGEGSRSREGTTGREVAEVAEERSRTDSRVSPADI